MENNLSLLEIELPKFTLPVKYEEIPYNEEPKELNNLITPGYKH